MSWASSVLTLTTLTLPAKSLATLSIVGVSIRHGPHHTAQKSTRTGLSDLVTSCSQFSPVTSITFALAMSLPFLVESDARRFHCYYTRTPQSGAVAIGAPGGRWAHGARSGPARGGTSPPGRRGPARARSPPALR